MKGTKISRGTAAIAIAIAMIPGPADAGLAVSVLDLDNLAVNTTTMASNIAQNFQLKAIRKQLEDSSSGTINYYTKNVDRSTTSIDESTTNIEKNIEVNTEIDTHFTWIINNNDGGGEIIPIPFDLNELMDGQTVDSYTGHYKTVEAHRDSPSGHYADAATMEASRARKAANDALVRAIESDDDALRSEADALKKLADLSRTAKGHGHQLQVSNALAGSQINQLMRLRSLTLVAEAARAAETQATADREARATAVGIRLRAGLDNAMNQAKVRQAAY